MTTALFIPADPHTPLEVFNLPGGYEAVQEKIGGTFDVVRNDDTVGYVHDEGLWIGLPYNHVASELFGQSLVGDVVVVGSLDESGYYDGDNHDVPGGYRVLAAVLNQGISDGMDVLWL